MTHSASRHSLGSRREHVHADVCVIGAGIAGLTAAVRIAAHSRLRVVVLESGTATALDHEAAMVGLDTVDDPTGGYQGIARGRGIGGTSAKWAGKLLPLSPGDMAARPYLDLPGWPITPDDLSRYTREIEAMMGVDNSPYEHDQDPDLDPGRLLPTGMSDIAWRWPKRPTRANHRIDHVLRHELERLNNLEIWTDATVGRLEIAEGRLTKVSATNHREGELTVAATMFVIAAGTLESTRLLLLADAQNEGCISRTTDSLGRYFNDHFGVEVAVLRAASITPLNRALADRKVNRTVRHLHGELSAGRQQAARSASAYFDFDAVFAEDSATARARAMIASLRARDGAAMLRHSVGMMRKLPALGQALAWQARHHQQFWSADAVINVKIWIEQRPIAANRLTLGERRDSLNMPMLHVDLERTSDDEHTLQTARQSLADLWHTHSTLGSLNWSTLPERAIDAASEQAHPAGSLRMGHDPRTSVVGPTLRVHAISNVQIASAAVFPTSGSANPTFTIMQLAMRAADDLLSQFRVAS